VDSWFRVGSKRESVYLVVSRSGIALRESDGRVTLVRRGQYRVVHDTVLFTAAVGEHGVREKQVIEREEHTCPANKTCAPPSGDDYLVLGPSGGSYRWYRRADVAEREPSPDCATWDASAWNR
jgi:hypothetical protein